MRRITNPQALRRAVADGCREFKLCLNGGLYSRKTITLQADGRFGVVNHIDDTVQRLTEKQLFTRSNIGRAMRVGAFITNDSRP